MFEIIYYRHNNQEIHTRFGGKSVWLLSDKVTIFDSAAYDRAPCSLFGPHDRVHWHWQDDNYMVQWVGNTVMFRLNGVLVLGAELSNDKWRILCIRP
jgi:hypothetical protein